MEPIVGVWLCSVLGAAGFSAAGYVLGQRGVVVPFLKLEGPAVTPTRPTGGRPPPALNGDKVESTETKRNEASRGIAEEERLRAHAESSRPEVARLDDDDREEEEEENETLVHDSAAIALAMPPQTEVLTPPRPSTLPPPRVPPKRTASEADAHELRLAKAELEVVRSDLEEARTRAQKLEEEARAATVARSELARQLDAHRAEVTREAVARTTAEAKVQELGDRLASASEDAAALRHRLATTDKQSKQLREALQGRVKALTDSEMQRRRNLEESENMRLKLKDVYDKLERSTLPPVAPAPSLPPVTQPGDSLARAREGREDRERRTAEDSVLRQEIVRLTAENRALRARALGSGSQKAAPARGSIPDVDIESYRRMITRIMAMNGIRGAVIADELGSVLVGSGDLAEGLAAFGAYIRDAAGRADGLLPLETLDHVDIRDRAGTLLSASSLAPPQSQTELLLVLLGPAEVTIAARRMALPGLPGPTGPTGDDALISR